MAVNNKQKTKIEQTTEEIQGVRLSGAHIVCECLVQEGVEVVFGYPGGAVLPLYDVLPSYKIRHILVRHEQAAAHAADGFARATGKVGVCLATSGPGATNLITGIANAFLDSSPVLALTGQVPTSYVGKDSFQEIDITGITLPITKHNYLVEDVEDLARLMKNAFHLANTGRPGPVLVDLPRDVLSAETVFDYPKTVHLRGYKPTLFGNIRQVKLAAQLINEARQPVIIAGRGVLISQACQELRELAEKADIPVVTTLLGVSCFPESHRLSFGMVGMHGMAYANAAIDNSDLVVAIGMRYDDRATGKTSAFAPNARIVHIDIDPAEIGKNIRVDVPIVGDVKNVLAQLNREVARAEHSEWIQRIADWRVQFPTTEIRDTPELLPQFVIRQLYEVTEGQAIIVTDVGQHQMWAAQHYWYDRPNTLISAGGLGAMGFGLPAAMGAKVGCPGETVWAIVGDGGFQMNAQELATLAQENIPVKVAILNNGCLGMVRQLQEFLCDRRYHHVRMKNPDFVKLTEAYGVRAFRVADKAEVRPTIEKAMAIDEPVVVEFVVTPDENVYPMVPPGSCLSEAIKDPRQVWVG